MCTTFTTLFQLMPLKRNDELVDVEQSDILSVKRVLSDHDFHCFDLTQICGETNPDFVTSYFRNSDCSRTILMSQRHQLLTLDFNETSSSTCERAHREIAGKIHDQLQSSLPKYTVKRIPLLKRGDVLWQYGELGDGRISENAITEVVFDKFSPFQRVTVVNTSDCGRMLMLDGIENLSEEDESYNRAICGLDRGVSYENKTVLILGGGDGAALDLLRKLPVRMITLVEIDDMVLRACKEHLRGCCGDSLDRREDSNYKIIVGDCLKHMEEFLCNNRKFDIIISDITDVPIDPNKSMTENDHIAENMDCYSGEGWQLMKKVYNLSGKLLEVDGVLMTHVTAHSNQKGIELFKKILEQLDESFEYELFTEWVPSFAEKWTFCQLKRS